MKKVGREEVGEEQNEEPETDGAIIGAKECSEESRGS